MIFTLKNDMTIDNYSPTKFRKKLSIV